MSCVARGSEVPVGATLVNIDRDQDEALCDVSEVSAVEWDAVVDEARQPGYVRRAVRDLAASATRYVFISSCSAYASLAEDGIEEDAALSDPLLADTMASPEDYGSAKAACEQALLAGFGSARSVIIRAGLIGGPGDPTGRTSYWPLRFAHPSNQDARVLVPDASQQSTSVIDVRDLAEWVVHLIAHSATGILNAVGDPTSLTQHLEVARAVATHTGDVIAAPAD